MGRINLPIGVPKQTRIALQRLASALGKDKNPEFESVICTNLDASEFVFTDTNKKLSSVNVPLTVAYGGTGVATLTTAYGLLAAGTTATGTVQTLSAGLTTQILVGGGASALPSWGTNIPTAVTIGSAYIYRVGGTDVSVTDGGTGASTLTQYSLLLGNGTSAVSGLGAATNGQLPIGSTGTTPVLAALTGTTNQITVTNGTGTITLSAPQNIHTAATPTFAGLTLTGFSGVIKATTGVLAGSATLDDVADGTSYERVAANQLSSGIYIDATTMVKGIASFATADFSVTSGAVSITDSGIDHDQTTNYVADKHVAHTGVSITAGTGMSGGGDISATRTLNCSITQYTDELAQDTVGGILTDTASINFTYDDVTPQITAAVLPAGVDHDSLNNFVADKHIAHSDVSIAAGAGLTGGGTIASTRTVSLSHLGIESLTDPGADRIAFWDDSETACKWLSCGNSVAITVTTLDTIQDIRTTASPTFVDGTFDGQVTVKGTTGLTAITRGMIDCQSAVGNIFGWSGTCAGDNTLCSWFGGRKSRGTLTVPTDVQNGDTIGGFINSSYSGAWKTTAGIMFTVDGTFTSGQNPPIQMDFYTNVANVGSTLNMQLFSTGNLKVTGNLDLGSGITATSAIPVLKLTQVDVSEEFIRFVGTSANGVLTQSIVEAADVATATIQGYYKIYIQDDGNQLTDQAYFVPVYTLT